MNENFCEVAVLGGGLAGCSAALSLAQSGVDVALFEAGELPRHRVCGEFLSPESRATLARLHVLPAIENAGARAVDRARFCCEGQSADFDLGQTPGLAISRFALDPILVDAARGCGARVRLGSKTRNLRRETQGFRFEAEGREWRARAVVVAAGRARSPRAPGECEARFVGIKAHFADTDLPVGAVEMHLFRGGYCGLVRVEGEATNACLMVSYARLGGASPEALWQELRREIPALEARFGAARRITAWQSTGNVSFGRFRPTGEAQNARQNASQIDAERDAHGAPLQDGPLPAKPLPAKPLPATPPEGTPIARGALCAGDTAGYIHPLTGDGMAMALRAGELAGATARLSAQGLNPDEAARLYGAAWHREFAARLKVAARLHPLALRPNLSRPVLPILRHFPALGSALVRQTRGSG